MNTTLATRHTDTPATPRLAVPQQPARQKTEPAACPCQRHSWDGDLEYHDAERVEARLSDGGYAELVAQERVSDGPPSVFLEVAADGQRPVFVDLAPSDAAGLFTAWAEAVQ